MFKVRGYSYKRTKRTNRTTQEVMAISSLTFFSSACCCFSVAAIISMSFTCDRMGVCVGWVVCVWVWEAMFTVPTCIHGGGCVDDVYQSVGVSGQVECSLQ